VQERERENKRTRATATWGGEREEGKEEGREEGGGEDAHARETPPCMYVRYIFMNNCILVNN